MGNLTTVNLTLQCKWNPGHQFTFQPVLNMLLRCPKLKHLYLYHFKASGGILNIPEFCSLRFQGLETLCVTSIAFGDHATTLLSSFISANPSVQEILFLPGDDFAVDPARPPFSAAVINRLTALNGTAETIARLIGSGRPTKLKSIFMSFGVHQVQIAYQVLSIAGPFLEGLTLYLLGSEGGWDWVLLTDQIRSNCPGIRRLTVQGNITGSRPGTVPDLPPVSLQ